MSRLFKRQAALRAAQLERNRLGAKFWDSPSGSTLERALVYAYNTAHKRCRTLGERGDDPRFIDVDDPGNMCMRNLVRNI